MSDVNNSTNNTAPSTKGIGEPLRTRLILLHTHARTVSYSSVRGGLWLLVWCTPGSEFLKAENAALFLFDDVSVDFCWQARGEHHSIQWSLYNLFIYSIFIYSLSFSLSFHLRAKWFKLF